MYKVELTVNSTGAWFWNLKEENGQTLATSEAYSSKAKCKQTAAKLAKKLETTVTVSEK